MVYIESAEAKKELGRIDDILNEKHLLIGGLAVKYFYPARESKDIDLVCSDAVRNTIIRELYPTNEWDIFDENMDEYRPDYHIKNKKNGLIISLIILQKGISSTSSPIKNHKKSHPFLSSG